MTTGTLTFFCGKMGAGKSTRAREIAGTTGAVLISEDAWLAALYPDQISNVQDYLSFSDRLKPPMRGLVRSILGAGGDVVLDFPANTPGQRAWLRGVSDGIAAPHRLIFLEVPDDVCLKRIARRAEAQPGREKTDTKEMFDQMARFFVPPHPDEGLTVEIG